MSGNVSPGFEYLIAKQRLLEFNTFTLYRRKAGRKACSASHESPYLLNLRQTLLHMIERRELAKGYVWLTQPITPPLKLRVRQHQINIRKTLYGLHPLAVKLGKAIPFFGLTRRLLQKLGSFGWA
jgi:hypothetical protein